MKNALPEQTKRAADLAAEKGASSWLMFIPVKDEDLTLSRREFKDAIHLRYYWQISDNPSTCKIEPVLQQINGEVLTPGTNKAADAQLDIQVCGFWERQALPFLTLMGVLPECSLIKASPQNKSISRTKPLYFTPLIFTTTGEMADECKRHRSRVAELLTTKKGYNFAVLRFFHFCDHSIVTFTTFLFWRILASSFSRLMEYAARKSNTTSMPLTLCSGYKLFTPNFKSAYLSFLDVVLADIVSGLQIVPLIMNHSLFTLSDTLMIC